MEKNNFFTTILGSDNDNKVLVEIKPKIAEIFHAWTEYRFDYFYAKEEFQRHTNKQKNKIFKQARKNIKEVRKFYDSCIVDFEYEDRTFSANQVKLQPEKLYKKIIENKLQDVYIVGSIGCGKSTYITALLEEFHKNQHNDNTFILSINITQIMLEGSYESEILKLLKNKVNAYLKPNSKINADTLKKFLSELEQKFPNNRTIFIFDNIDQVYDESIKLIISELLTDDEKDAYLNNKLFLTQSLLLLKESIRKHCNKNTNFLYAMRPNTYKNINPSGHENHTNNRNSVIAISSKDLRFVNKVIDKRLDMLELPDEKYKQLIKDNLHEIAKHSTNYNLHGLRHAINNIQVFLSRKITRKYPEWMNSIFLFLDNRATYTQNRTKGSAGVANIFLINAQCRIDKTDMPNSVAQEHYQSYWLKYFIVCSIYDINELKNKKEGGSFNDNEIYNHQFDKYEKHIYKLCIYSLSEVVHGRLIACDYLTDSYRLYDTQRLKKCVEENIFFSFIYLSAIVDDTYLEFPKTITNKITRKQIYQSFFPNDDEHQWWVEWLKKSVKKVFLFLQILESSLENYEVYFLNNELYDKYKPNFVEIKASINEEILKIGIDLHMQEIEVKDIVASCTNQAYAEKDNLNDFFSNYKDHVSN